MGTNFYLRRPLPEEQKYKITELLKEDNYNEIEKILEYSKEIHIGKRSYGWKFL